MKRSIKKIRNNIQKFGYHAYLVSGGDIPTFSYTIGLRNVVGKEIILAGGAYYSADAVFEIIATLARRYLRGEGINDTSFSVDQIGQFDLRPVHQSWVRQLMLGALDYYNNETVPAVQVCPDDGHRTIDVPDMSVGFIPKSADYDPWAQPRSPMDMMRYGCSTSLFQARQQWSTMSS
ncbi:DUF4262 domain-containing protein [Nitrospirillum viridazoti]|uniref:Uncharacterized protein n=1 Tax=Nitrospirillum viridazoti CBAmc TaxID=1441467 RepID=A0A248JVB1_9PROT|nr:hypothetical protein Y958_17125 [Nitrospirillum amazonense CBAmc]